MKKTAKAFKRLLACAISLTLALSCVFGIFDGAFSVSAAGYGGYKPETANYLEARQLAEEITLALAQEGMTLLKNNGVLPLDVSNGMKVTVLGKNSVNPVYGGSGSAGGGMPKVDLYLGLENAGFEVNPIVKAFYENNDKSGAGRPATPAQGSMPSGYATAETPQALYTAAEKDSFAQYSDAAIVFISRIGGEGYDLPTTSYQVDADGNETLTPGRESKDEHYLQLDKNEKDLINMATENFDKVIIVLNAGATIELADVEANENIDAIVWAGCPGVNGFDALGQILNGAVNPSGRTVDTYATDFKAAPVWQNFAVNAANGLADAANNTYVNSNGETTKYHGVEYEEGIYVGYRYYETRGYTDGESWYDSNVVYPFGYGLSYTTFDWQVSFPENKTITKDGKIEVTVKVTNTGDYAGKDVVQLYFSAPYLSGEIEKSHVVLGGFAKTELLYPGQSETVIITVDPYTMASYDYNDANVNNFMGYELDAGDYVIYVGKNAHDAWTNGYGETFKLNEGIQFDTDPTSGNAVENRFDDVSAHFEGGRATILSRNDWEGTFPTYMEAEDLVLDEDAFNMVEMTVVDTKFDEGKPWYTNVMPNQAADTSATDVIKLEKLIGLDYDDPMWDTFMDQFTVEELANMMNGNYSIAENERLGIPLTHVVDGPAGFVYQMGGRFGVTGNFYCAPVLVASTWNVELAEKQGEILGEEALWTNTTGMYGPATNTHRTPFSGRNFEYYSEDGFIAGKICAAVTKGLRSRGVITFVKHFAVNDQETNRDTLAGLITYANEQAMREIYLKSFELAVKEGGSNGIMSAFNRIGLTNASESYALLTEVLRNEWGFVGTVVTDFGGSMTQYANPNVLIRVGNDIWLGNLGAGALVTSGDDLTATHVTALRNAAKHSLYTVANSAAMNSLSSYWMEHYVSGGNPWTGNFNMYGKVELGNVERGQEFEMDLSSTIHGTDGSVVYEGLNLPKGLRVDPLTGILSGTIAQDAEDGYYLGVVNLKTRDGKSIGEQIRVIMTLPDSSAKPEDLSHIDEMIYSGVTKAIAYNNVEFCADISVSGGVDGRIVVVPGAWGAVNYYNVADKPVVYTISDGELPAGLWLSHNGLIKGKTTAQAGDYSIEITATSQENGAILKQKVTITVEPFATVTFNGGALATAYENSGYTANVGVAAGSDAVKYTATGLPAGLTMGIDGIVTGIPTTAGEYTVEVTADVFGGEAKTAVFTLTVAEQPKVEVPVQPDPTTPSDPVEQPEPQDEDPGSLMMIIGIVMMIAAVALTVVVLIKNRKK